jgi:hypothetical protein
MHSQDVTTQVLTMPRTTNQQTTGMEAITLLLIHAYSIVKQARQTIIHHMKGSI